MDDDHPVINIESPTVPANYEQSVTCQWLIIQTNATQRIKLQLDLIDIMQDSMKPSNHSIGNMIDNECKERYLQVKDMFAVPHLVGKFCGKQIPPAIISVRTMLRIIYVTRGSQSKFKMSLSSTG